MKIVKIIKNSKIIKRILPLMMAILMISSTFVVALAATGTTGWLGTNKALGSPLLDSGFNANAWNKWELICFGTFLSNFTVPMTDDYHSAFGSGYGGSEGAGAKALAFGSGSREDALKSMLTYVANMQTAYGKQIYFRAVQVPNGANGYVSDNNTIRQASLRDQASFGLEDANNMTPPDPNSTSIVQDPNRAITTEDLAVLNSNNEARAAYIFGMADTASGRNFMGMGWEIYDASTGGPFAVGFAHDKERDILEGTTEKYRTQVVKNVTTGYFYIKSESGTPIVILDLADPYDVGSLSAWYSKGVVSDTHKESVAKGIDKYTSETNDAWKGYKLVLDSFGNICVNDNGRYIVAYPAAMNQHLTKSNSINLLNSAMLGGNYCSLNGSGYVLKAEAAKKDKFLNGGDYEGGTAAISGHDDAATKFMGAGTTVILQDTDSLFQRVPDGQKVKYGDILHSFYAGELFKSNNPIPWKIEIVGMDKQGDSTSAAKNLWIFDGLSTWLNTSLSNQTDVRIDSIAQLFNFNNIYNLGIDPDIPVLYQVNDYFDEKKFTIFDATAVVPVHIWIDNPSSSTGDETKKDTTRRQFANYLGRLISTNRYSMSGVSPKSILDEIKRDTFSTAQQISKNMTNGTLGSQLFSDFLAEYQSGDGWTGSGVDIGDSQHYFQRLVRVYPKSATMRYVAMYLGLNEQTEFAVWAPKVYYTYLEWYGIVGNDSNGKDSKFKTEIFDEKSDLLKFDVKAITISEEEMKSKLLQQAYAITNPSVGRDLRKQIFLNNFQDWLYDGYTKIVYGGSIIEYQSNVSKVSSNRNSSGFLSIDNYYDNPFTSWFMNIYGDIALIILGVGIIIVLISGLITRKGLAWFIISVVMVVNIVLVTPSMGEIVPYVSEKIVTSMFGDRINFWAASELIENARLLNASGTGQLVDGYGNDVSAEVLALVKEFNTVYLDRSLMLRLDISKKVTQTKRVKYMAELQRMQSTRWLLPTIMRQFSATNSEDSYKYVYVSMSEYFDSARQLYQIYYMPGERSSDMGTTYNQKDYSPDFLFEPKQMWSDYTPLYETYYQIVENGDVVNNGDRLIASRRSGNTDKAPHTIFYLLNSVSAVGHVNTPVGFQAPTINLNNTLEKIEEQVVAAVPGIRDKMGILSVEVENAAGDYLASDDSSVRQLYGYLWMTESPYFYFYTAIKDLRAKTSGTGAGGDIFNAAEISSIDPMMSMADFVTQLQGRYTDERGTANTNKAENKFRHTFMRENGTGDIKDFCDLRELFTNVLPYMYTMQILAGGVDGDGGVFGDKLITDYTIYNDFNLKSWMFRSNWVTKLMESKEYNTVVTAVNSRGEKFNVEKQLLPSNYLFGLGNTSKPGGRQMVFSQEEMNDMQLTQFDLTHAELKIQKFYEQTERDITILLNYVNLDGINTEVMYELMALIATNNFCKVFSPDNGINDKLALYPQSLELRNISFDSVLRMLMLNATNDTTYVYGDTMYNVIANADIISAIFLLITCACCVWIIPFTRNVIMALLLFLGLYATLTQIVAGDKLKVKVTASYFLNLIIFLVMNIAFFGAISLLMGVVSPTDVLSIKSVGSTITSPFWVLLVLMILCGLYLFGAFKMLKFTIKNYKDMGAVAYGAMLSNIGDKIGGGFSSFGGMLAGMAGFGVGRATAGGDGDGSGEGSGESGAGSSGSSSSDTMEVDSGESTDGESTRRTGSDSGYVDEMDMVEEDHTTAGDIDSAIADGRDAQGISSVDGDNRSKPAEADFGGTLKEFGIGDNKTLGETTGGTFAGGAVAGAESRGASTETTERVAVQGAHVDNFERKVAEIPSNVAEDIKLHGEAAAHTAGAVGKAAVDVGVAAATGGATAGAAGASLGSIKSTMDNDRAHIDAIHEDRIDRSRAADASSIQDALDRAHHRESSTSTYTTETRERYRERRESDINIETTAKIEKAIADKKVMDIESGALDISRGGSRTIDETDNNVTETSEALDTSGSISE